jgi:hypothetical protein
LELSRGDDTPSGVYSLLAFQANSLPAFEPVAKLSLGVMAYPLELQDSILYIFTSDTAGDATIDVRDKETGVSLKFTLPAEHAALALIGKKEKAVIAKYGF